MSTVKQQILDVVTGLPDDCTWDDVLLKLELLRHFPEAEEAEREGRVFTQQQAMERLLSWPESSGPNQP